MIENENNTIEEELFDNGYKKFAPSPIDHEGIECMFQKCFRDDIGKRYFIDFKKWKPVTHPHTHETFPASYEGYVQLYRKDSHDAVDLIFHSSWTREQVEEHVAALFATGFYDYYEKFYDAED